jgi:hypothetical protein
LVVLIQVKGFAMGQLEVNFLVLFLEKRKRVADQMNWRLILRSFQFPLILKLFEVTDEVTLSAFVFNDIAIALRYFIDLRRVVRGELLTERQIVLNFVGFVVLRIFKIIFGILYQARWVVIFFLFGWLSDDFGFEWFLFEQVVDIGLGKSLCTGHKKLAHNCTIDSLIDLKLLCAVDEFPFEGDEEFVDFFGDKTFGFRVVGKEGVSDGE